MSLFVIQAQTVSTIHGVVLDSTGAPVKFATVKISEKPDGIIKAFAIADSAGVFTIEFEPFSSQFFITVSAVGFRNKVFSLSIERIKNFAPNNRIFLESSGKALQEIIIKADPKIKQNGDTISFKTEAFKQGNESNLKDLFEKLPGFKVSDNGQLSFNGKPISKILIEGDDLFGSGYNSLMENLSVGGIEKVDVINNFTDQTDIVNKITGGKEQVVNLKFKRAKYFKSYGTLSGAGGIPYDRYELKFDMVALVPKSKWVLLGNSNSIGRISSELLQKDRILQIQTQDKFQGFKPPAIQYISQINEIISGSIPSRRTNFNNTHFASINWQARPSNKFLVTGSVTGSKDFYKQMLSRNQRQFAPNGIVQIEEMSEIARNINVLASEVQLNYTITPKLQFISESSIVINPGNDRTTGSFQQQSLSQRLSSDKFLFQQQLIINKLIDSVSGIKVRLYGSRNTIDQHHSVMPPLYSGLISNPDLYSSFFQNAGFLAQNAGAAIKYFRKFKRGVVNNELIFFSGMERMMSDVLLQIKNSSQTDKQNNFENQLTFSRFTATNRTTVSYSFNQKLSLSAGVSLMKLNLRLRYPSLNRTSNLNQWLLLPSASLSQQLKNNGQFSFTYSAGNQLPLINQIYQQNVLNTNRDFIRGNSELNSVVNHSAVISFTKSNLIKSKFLFFSSANYSSRGITYLSNSIITSFYTIRENIITDKRSSDLLFISRIEKYWKPLRSNFTFDVTAGRQYNFNLIDAVLFASRSTAYSLSFQMKSGFDKFFNFQARVRFSETIGRNKSEQATGAKFANQQVNPSATLVFRPGNKTIFDYSIEALVIRDAVGNTSSVIFHDFNLKYLIKKDKIDIALIGRNLSNQQNFIFSTVNPLSETSSLNRLLPRFVLLQLNYRF
ncbi:TonB-dependent receptor [Lacibacter sp. MH-610]|uniref:TonB-dependent receptor n=1 Tax=Lacibacter sp. MH-610 TaxID=3020883 RepID=UPI003891C163